jgi:flagellar basal-body rod modification protein FlgD
MSVPAVNNGTSLSPTSTTDQANGLGGQDFLQLLVMQLKNQDPLNPIDDREFISQMAQLSSLEATNTLSSQVGEMVTNARQMGALQLVGRDVEYTAGDGSTASGKVTGVRLGASSPMLRIGSAEVPLEQVQTVL